MSRPCRHTAAEKDAAVARYQGGTPLAKCGIPKATLQRELKSRGIRIRKREELRVDDREFFDARYSPEAISGCWIWHGALNASGYGAMSGRWLSHRFSWTVHRGPIPKGMFVCHTCDVRSCVNPDHLFLGTNDDNMKDMVRKGRARNNPARGDDHPTARFKSTDVMEMRRLAAAGIRIREIANLFGARPGTISTIVNRRTWRTVP